MNTAQGETVKGHNVCWMWDRMTRAGFSCLLFSVHRFLGEKKGVFVLFFLGCWGRLARSETVDGWGWARRRWTSWVHVLVSLDGSFLPEWQLTHTQWQRNAFSWNRKNVGCVPVGLRALTSSRYLRGRVTIDKRFIPERNEVLLTASVWAASVSLQLSKLHCVPSEPAYRSPAFVHSENTEYLLHMRLCSSAGIRQQKRQTCHSWWHPVFCVFFALDGIPPFYDSSLTKLKHMADVRIHSWSLYVILDSIGLFFGIWRENCELEVFQTILFQLRQQ